MTNTKHTKREYDKFAREYHEHLLDNKENAWHRYVEKPVMKSILKDIIKNKIVLDVGCGSGIFTNELLKFKPKKIVGCDLSNGLIDIAKKEYSNINFYACDAKKTHFKKQEFEIVTSSLMCHYFDDLVPLFKEINRILKPNGYFVFSMHHPVMEITGKLVINNKIDKKNSIFREYFKEGLYKWKLGSEMKNMIAYHHTFETIFNSLNKSGFVVENLFETKALNELKKINKKEYNRVMKRPSFLVIKARKI